MCLQHSFQFLRYHISYMIDNTSSYVIIYLYNARDKKNSMDIFVCTQEVYLLSSSHAIFIGFPIQFLVIEMNQMN